MSYIPVLRYLGRNGHVYETDFSPEKVRELWTNGNQIAIDLPGPSTVVVVNVFPGDSKISLNVRDGDLNPIPLVRCC